MAFEERFEVGDSICHVIGYAPTYREAYGIAGIATVSGHRNCPGITIYDVLQGKAFQVFAIIKHMAEEEKKA